MTDMEGWAAACMACIHDLRSTAAPSCVLLAVCVHGTETFRHFLLQLPTRSFHGSAADTHSASATHNHSLRVTVTVGSRAQALTSPCSCTAPAFHLWSDTLPGPAAGIPGGKGGGSGATSTRTAPSSLWHSGVASFDAASSQEDRRRGFSRAECMEGHQRVWSRITMACMRITFTWTSCIESISVMGSYVWCIFFGCNCNVFPFDEQEVSFHCLVERAYIGAIVY
jgi:hypothetical protein